MQQQLSLARIGPRRRLDARRQVLHEAVAGFGIFCVLRVLPLQQLLRRQEARSSWPRQAAARVS